MGSTVEKSVIETAEHSDGSVTDSGEPADRKFEKDLVRKIDFQLIPILFLLYLCAFIDRINIGNVKLQGILEDLRMKGNDYSIALFTFFIPYILLEVPSNMILKRFRPSVWISSIMFCWGIITICQGLAQSFAGLVICRTLLGVFEAGFFPGCIYLISMYYKRYELQWRVNLFFSASILAGAFSGLLTYSIVKMDGLGGYNGWRWVFILEGLFTVVVAIISRWLIPDWPETAKFLSNKERAFQINRLANDDGHATMSKLNKQAVRRIFSDIKIYLGILMFLGTVNTGYASSFFTPTILHELGWTAVRAQVMSIPIYIVATLLALTTAILADRFQHRFAFILIGCCVATIGYSILLAMDHVKVPVRYFAVFLITGGGYIAQPVCNGWLANNLGGHYKRGVGLAMQVGFGNIGGIIASNIFISSQAPRFPVGFGVSLALIWVSVLSSVTMFFVLKTENKKRDQGKRDYLLQLPEEELSNLGDGHPSFRYTY